MYDGAGTKIGEPPAWLDEAPPIDDAEAWRLTPPLNPDLGRE
jgi:hypothetical protein